MIDWSKPSVEHFRHIRSLPMTHLPSGLDYNIKRDGNTLYIAFQETGGIKEWNDNLNYFPEVFDVYTKVKAHRGIAKQYLSIRELILTYLYSGSIKQVYVAGYSLGGALTITAVQDIGYHIDRDKLNVHVAGIAYSPPRMFCPNTIVKKAVKNRLLLVKTHWDPVVHSPCKIMILNWTLQLKPLRCIFVKPTQWISFWADYGKAKWIGRVWRVLPLQHWPDQIERALKEYEIKK